MNSEAGTSTAQTTLFDFDFDDEDDHELALAIQHSLAARQVESHSKASTSTLLPPRRSFEEKEKDDLYVPRSRLETALAIAGATPGRREAQPSIFGTPTLLINTPRRLEGSETVEEEDVLPDFSSIVDEDEDTTMDDAALSVYATEKEHSNDLRAAPVMDEGDSEDDDMEEVVVSSVFEPIPADRSILRESSEVVDLSLTTSAADGESLGVITNVTTSLTSSPMNSSRSTSSNRNAISVGHASQEVEERPIIEETTPLRASEPSIVSVSRSARLESHHLTPAQRSNIVDSEGEDDGDGEPLGDWSRSPSPVAGASTSTPRDEHNETWDAAQEMDIVGEEGEFARFVSQVKGRNVETVRAEIDQEIKSLHLQRKAAMRDSEDVTQQMISQIMVWKLRINLIISFILLMCDAIYSLCCGFLGFRT